MSDDSPLFVSPTCPLTTKRMVTAQISLCVGCCCGNVSRGKPEVPVDRLKQEWRARGLSKVIQLTVSGCLGPCDLVNVVRISGASDDVWLGNLRSIDDYLDLVSWAEQSKDEGTLAPLTSRMIESRFDPFRRTHREQSRLYPESIGFSTLKGIV